MANYYPVNYLVSLNYCAYCLPSSYYVSIANTCIAAVCGNGFKEASEECDDNNTSAGDGCDATCNYEIRYICNAQPL